MRKVFYPVIIVFWLAMWGVLIRTEMRPDEAALMEVPISHIEKLFYRHEQISDLGIFAGRERIGQVQLAPRNRSDSREYGLRLNASLTTRSPSSGPQHWGATFSLDSNSALEPEAISFILMEKSQPKSEQEGLHLWLSVDPKGRTASYSLKIGGETLENKGIPISEAGLAAVAEQLGVDPSMLASFKSSQSTAIPEFRAYRTHVTIRGDEVAAYEVRGIYNGQTLFEAHVSEIGQIMDAKTILGWEMKPD